MTTKNSKLKILVFGAGVLGSLYAARLQDAGQDVTAVARGKRYEDLKQHGIVLEYFDSGEETRTAVKVVEKMPEDEYYDFCLVPIQKTQLKDALPILAANKMIPTFLFMVNSAEGPAVMVDALGRERVVLGFANAGGERDGHLVRLMFAKGRAITMGELDGKTSDRLEQIASAFREADIPVEFSSNMDAWLRYHVALVGPLANAMYMAGACNYKLAQHPEIVRKGLRGMREAFRVLQAHGFPAEPPMIKTVFAIPEFILVPLARKLFGSKLLDIGGARHARSARAEMTKLNEELLDLARQAGIKTPYLDELHRYADPAVPPAVFG
ncbi:MAG: ketopantoate reductase family protein [Firmicutes bacterium]|nr:ketopantoate reductase family protein [Bacillota bacterium]